LTTTASIGFHLNCGAHNKSEKGAEKKAVFVYLRSPGCRCHQRGLGGSWRRNYWWLKSMNSLNLYLNTHTQWIWRVWWEHTCVVR